MPAFHIGKLVPKEYFVDRESQIAEAQERLRDRQSFLLVGNKRSGKTSLSQILMDWLKEQNTLQAKNRQVVCYISVERDPRQQVTTFLEHTILNMAAETARQAFGLLFNEFESLDSATIADNKHLRTLHAIHKKMIKRSIYRGNSGIKPLVPDEFVKYTKDLINITRSVGWDGFARPARIKVVDL